MVNAKCKSTFLAISLLTVPAIGIAQEAKPASVQALISINSADQSTLEKLNGVGPVKAAAIVEYREKEGAFKSVDDLVKVKGIGAKTLEKNRAAITL